MLRIGVMGKGCGKGFEKVVLGGGKWGCNVKRWVGMRSLGKGGGIGLV